MKSRLIFATFWLASALLLGGCATMQKTYHPYFMRGSIIEAAASDVYLCIGSADGAKIGQELDVYKINTRITRKPGEYSFTRELTGKVRITQIVDEHFARAEVISGTVARNEIAELKVAR